MPTPDKASLATSYKKTMDDMRQELSATERIWSRLVHSPLGTVIGGLCSVVLFRPQALLIGGSLGLATLLGSYLAAHLYNTPLNNTEPLIAFVFGWCIGVLYDLFFVATKRHIR